MRRDALVELVENPRDRAARDAPGRHHTVADALVDEDELGVRMQHILFALASFPRIRQGIRRWSGVAAALGMLLLVACRPKLVSLDTLAPSVHQSIRYATAANFVGAPIDGYHAPRCWLTEPAARALASAETELAGQGLTLLVFDCYRPERAVRRFMHWAADAGDQRTKDEYYPRVSKADLVPQGYVAERSGHSRGSTLDVTLARPCGEHVVVPLDMGTAFDFFDPRSHYSSDEVTPEQRENRRRLREVMEHHGFHGYEPEWWHFTLNDEPYPDRYFDVPIE
jgi:D-alanyl-D-alanine dipeptidase